jgi:hypothetical protein
MKKKTKSPVSQLADAIQALNFSLAIQGKEEVKFQLSNGKFLYLQVASDVDEDVRQTKFQRTHGGPAGLFFELLETGDGGQFDGYLSDEAAPMPRRLALRAAHDVLETLGL